ncbi:MAG: hypothetical protein ABL885_04485 [Methylophilaceae bacterium]
MKLIVKLIALTLLLFSLALIGALVLAVEDKPRLQGRADLTAERIAHGKQFFEQNDPRRLKAGSVKQIRLEQEDLDLAINYFANQYLGAVAGLSIDAGQAVIEGTLNLPQSPLGRFLNVKIAFKQTDKLPTIDHVMLGKLWVPGFIAEFLMESILPRIQPLVDWGVLDTMMREVKFEQQYALVTYQWQNNLPAQFSGIVFSVEDQEKITIYQQRLSELTIKNKGNLELTRLMQPLFQLAQERSQNSDAIAENRALILVLTFYVNHKALNKILPQPQLLIKPKWRKVTLNGRDDFPKHYLVSALLAAYAGTPLANAVGLFKEMEDSQSGSGFSFNDIAADRAGTRMGELAIGSELNAQKIQALMMQANESDIMPKTSDLPEYMAEAEFKRRFGGTQGAPYQKMMREIERRVAALPINQ